MDSWQQLFEQKTMKAAEYLLLLYDEQFRLEAVVRIKQFIYGQRRNGHDKKQIK